jgi:hypothetical protein
MVNETAAKTPSAIYRRAPISRVLMVALWLTLAEGRKAGYLLILAK